jgi:hypothetical protein
LKQREPISPLKILSCRKYSFQKLTKFSQEKNALDVPASNVDVFLWRDTCVSSSQMCMGLFGTNTAYVHLDMVKLQDVFISKNHSVLIGK